VLCRVFKLYRLKLLYASISSLLLELERLLENSQFQVEIVATEVLSLAHSVYCQNAFKYENDLLKLLISGIGKTTPGKRFFSRPLT